MINDRLYREFKSQPFQVQYNGSEQFSDFRETLMIDEIIKCGKEILGSVDVQRLDQEATEINDEQTYLKQSRDQINKKQNEKVKYIYEYDYGKDNKNQRQYSPDHQPEELSFSLSNEDNKKQPTQEDEQNQYVIHEPRVKWKKNLVEEDSQYLKRGEIQKSSSNAGKWVKPAKTFEKTTFQKNSILLNSPTKSKNDHKKQTQEAKRSNPKDNQKYQTQRQGYKTPEKMTKMSKKTFNVPLSEKITKKYIFFYKSVYGRLKHEVQGQKFIEEYESRERKSQQQSVERWKGFINRSQKWNENRKSHILEMKMNEQHFSPIKSRSRSKGRDVKENQYSSYVQLKVRRQPVSTNGQYIVRNENRIYPENTFRMKVKSPPKRESSVQNCINKLKTQTQLLKVKLLNPLKKQIDSNEQISHYKMLNESQSRKSIQKFKQTYEEKPFAQITSTQAIVKNLYGNGIGKKHFK